MHFLGYRGFHALFATFGTAALLTADVAVYGLIDDSGHHLGQYWLRGGIYRALVACFYHCLAHSVRAYVVWRTALAAAGGAVGQQAVTGCSAARLMGYTV